MLSGTACVDSSSLLFFSGELNLVFQLCEHVLLYYLAFHLMDEIPVLYHSFSFFTNRSYVNSVLNNEN